MNTAYTASGFFKWKYFFSYCNVVYYPWLPFLIVEFFNEMKWNWYTSFIKIILQFNWQKSLVFRYTSSKYGFIRSFALDQLNVFCNAQAFDKCVKNCILVCRWISMSILFNCHNFKYLNVIIHHELTLLILMIKIHHHSHKLYGKFNKYQSILLSI